MKKMNLVIANHDIEAFSFAEILRMMSTVKVKRAISDRQRQHIEKTIENLHSEDDFLINLRDEFTRILKDIEKFRAAKIGDMFSIRRMNIEGMNITDIIDRLYESRDITNAFSGAIAKKIDELETIYFSGE